MSDHFPYQQCPKCSHAPLPQDQTLPAACPGCGVILAKFQRVTLNSQNSAGLPRIPVTDPEQVSDVEPSLGLWSYLRAAVLYLPARVEPAVFRARAALLLLFAVWGCKLIAMDYRTGELASSFLHGPLLVFHEAGHVIFRPFGEFITVLGGTLGQLTMPAIMTVALLRHRDPFGASIAAWLFGVSVLDVAPYIYDALHPQLILLGGHTGEEGGHDWIYLLGTTGLLQKAQLLGAFTHTCGAALVLLSLSWAGWLLMKQKALLSSEGL